MDNQETKNACETYLPAFANFMANNSLKMPILYSSGNVMGLSGKKFSEDYSKKMQNSNFIKRVYYGFKKRHCDKIFERATQNIETSLKGKGLTKELTLHILDVLSTKKNSYIPIEIQKRMNELPRVNLKDEKKLEELLQEYFRK